MLEGKIVVVSGAGDGIGAACAEKMLAQGAEYVAVADIDAAKGRKITEALNGKGYSADFFELDVRVEAQWQTMFDAIIAKHGRVDVLVNNAGICILKDIESMTFDEFRQVNDVNATGVFLGTRCAILSMRACTPEGEAASGSIVNIASIAGQVGMRGGIAYGAGKAAVTNMTKALAVECAEKREFIRVNSVHPGTVKTDMTTTMFGEEYFANVDNFSATPMKDFAMPEDIANAVVYLASDQSKLVTGSELTVDGGLTSGLAGEF
ncbi:MAG: SDR family NAD(P)-dependent oxidoreductase [Pseudomonadales bacterium]